MAINTKRTPDTNHIAGIGLQGGVHAGARAEAARHHHRRFIYGTNIFGVIEEISLARHRAFAHIFSAVRVQGQIIKADKFRLLISAAGNLQQIQPFIIQPTGDLHGLLMAETAFLEIGGIEFQRDGERITHGFANGANTFQQQPRAVFKTAAPLVGAVINIGRQKLRQQIAMRAM